MRHAIIGVIDSPHAVRFAAIITLLLGYFFIFLWAPHPWSWQGIDSYHELAKSLARGEPFQTTDVPWGYAYYAAAFYRLFGERLWIPLVAQATLNAAVPFLLFRLMVPVAGRRVATLSALIAGVFSFNTIYASTQSSDSICTVLFLAGLLGFASGVRDGRLRWFALSGVIFGLVPQFRPNLVLFPACMVAGYLLLRPRGTGKLARIAVFASLVIALQLPWVLRTYQLTGLLLPTSTHGGVQLWYGTLQVGPYLESRSHNPRFHFASPAFTYTSLWQRPIVIQSAIRNCVGDPAAPTRLVYWTDHDPQRRPVMPEPGWSETRGATFHLPARANGTVLYYYFEQSAAAVAEARSFTAPLGGAANPYVAFVSDDHLADLDRHDDVLDVFDLVRVLRHLAWQEPPRAAAKVDLDRDGRILATDVNAMITALIPDLAAKNARPPARIEVGPESVTLHFADQSWLSVPRVFGGRQTDLGVSLDGEMAPAMLSRHRTFTSLGYPDRPPRDGCLPAGDVVLNGAFYVAEPHMMQRYMALAWDNIERDPVAFVLAALYRVPRLFIVRGTDDPATAQQFRASSVIYALGTALSIAYFVVFAAGVVIAYRRRSAMLVFLVPIVYVPATIAWVLTNMRYTVTVQPLMFAFVALAIASAFKLDAVEERTAATPSSATAASRRRAPKPPPAQTATRSQMPGRPT